MYEAVAKTADQAKLLADLERSESFDFWTAVRINGPTDVMTSPEQSEEFLDFMRAHSIQYRLKIEDVQK